MLHKYVQLYSRWSTEGKVQFCTDRWWYWNVESMSSTHCSMTVVRWGRGFENEYKYKYEYDHEYECEAEV